MSIYASCLFLSLRTLGFKPSSPYVVKQFDRETDILSGDV